MKMFAVAAALAGGMILVANTGTPAAADPANAASADIERPDVQAMKMADIRRFNQTVPTKHRYYIVCRQSTVTGSLAKVRRVCQTRDDWERSTREAQSDAESLLAGGRASSGCNPYCLDGQTKSAGTPQF